VGRSSQHVEKGTSCKIGQQAMARKAHPRRTMPLFLFAQMKVHACCLLPGAAVSPGCDVLANVMRQQQSHSPSQLPVEALQYHSSSYTSAVHLVHAACPYTGTQVGFTSLMPRLMLMQRCGHHGMTHRALEVRRSPCKLLRATSVVDITN
jgi:hypothetical protein